MAKSLKLTINLSSKQFEKIKTAQGYARFCWETYGRYLSSDTKAEININIKP